MGVVGPLEDVASAFTGVSFCFFPLGVPGGVWSFGGEAMARVVAPKPGVASFVFLKSQQTK